MNYLLLISYTAFPSIGSEMERWHTLQEEREVLLKEVEEQVSNSNYAYHTGKILPHFVLTGYKRVK